MSEIYDRLDGTYQKIHNLYLAFSLQPKPLLAADRHFRDVMHNPDNQLSMWFLELLASQVAIIAECHYALTHHGANFKHLLGDEQLGESMLQAVREDNFVDNSLFTPKHAALLVFGAKLSRCPQDMTGEDIESLRQVGVTDTEILEAVQATSCFAYWVRFINALGIKSVMNDFIEDADSSPRCRSSDTTTSSEVTVLPLWNVTPSRNVKIHSEGSAPGS
ncbi:MAG: hypothetical protein OXI60_07795 [Acidiferrobacterales bacterium]|nr:hypothetical protein [Acidiferrobacterales bacterium]